MQASFDVALKSGEGHCSCSTSETRVARHKSCTAFLHSRAAHYSLPVSPTLPFHRSKHNLHPRIILSKHISLFAFLCVFEPRQPVASMDMDIHGMLRPQLTINSASMPGFNADQSTVGSEHRRAGPPHLQQTHWFPGSQAVTYGPYDPIPEFGNSDAFVNQADEIDRHRQLLSGRTPIPGAPFAGLSLIHI